MIYQPEHWDWLLRLARASIAHGFDHGAPLHGSARGVAAPYAARRAAFVGLTVHGENRGCVGDTEATVNLYDSVRTNAHRAAFGDARFSRPGRGIMQTGSLQVFVFTDHRKSTVNDLKLNDSVVVNFRGRQGIILSQYRGPRSNAEFVRMVQAKANLQDVPIHALEITALETEMSERTPIPSIGEFHHEWF